MRHAVTNQAQPVLNPNAPIPIMGGTESGAHALHATATAMAGFRTENGFI
jgi:hypothetical protein